MGRFIDQTKQHQVVDHSKKQQPCLFLFQELTGETKHAFINPINRTLHPINFPELNFSLQCLSSRFGWLLLVSRETSSLFFFNPFTRVRIQLPYLHHCIDVAVFSAPPTSPDCIVVALNKPYQYSLRIDTLRVGESKWTKLPKFGETRFDTPVQGLYSGHGHVYCMDSIGRVGDFDVCKSTWRIVQKDKCRILKDSVLIEASPSSSSSSSNGEILIGVRGNGVFNGLYKLNVDEEEAKEGLKKVVDELGNDDTVFLGPYGSCVFSSNPTDEKKSQIVVGGYESDFKCTVYDFDGANDWKEKIVLECKQFGSTYTPIWIEPSE